MKKNQEVQIETGLEIRESYIDPDTRQEITVNAEQMRELATLEFQIASGVATVMLALKTVRDKKLYLLRSDTLEDYLRSIGIAPRTAYRQLQIADSFGASSNFNEISKLPQTLLLDAAKNDDLAQQLRDGEVRTADGEVLTIDEIVSARLPELKTLVAKQKKEITRLKGKYAESDEQYKSAKSRLDEWEDRVGKGKFRQITQKNEAMGALNSAHLDITRAIQDLSAIDSQDPEVISEIGALIGKIKFAVDALEDKWIPSLLKEKEA